MAHSNISHDSGRISSYVRKVPGVWDGRICIEAIPGRETLSGSLQVFQIEAYLGFMTHTHHGHLKPTQLCRFGPRWKAFVPGWLVHFAADALKKRLEGATIFDQNIGTELAILYITLPCMCCAVGPFELWLLGCGGCKGCKCHYDYFYACFIKSKKGNGSLICIIMSKIGRIYNLVASWRDFKSYHLNLKFHK